MKVSIITVTYNSEAFLEQTINSIRAQTYPNIEHLIIDGGSTDNTVAIARKYRDRPARVISEKDDGIFDAMNKGISNADGDIIGILNSDDFYSDADVIQRVVDGFAEKEVEAVYANLYFVDKDNPDKITRKWKSGKYSHGNFLFGWMPPHPTLFVRRKVYEKYGLFNLDFRTAADYELMLRFIHKHQIRLNYVDEFIVKMRTGGQSTASISNRLKANIEDRRAWQVNDLKPKFFTLWLKPLRKARQFF